MKKLSVVALGLVLCTLFSACGATAAVRDEMAYAPKESGKYMLYAADQAETETVNASVSYGYASGSAPETVATVEQKLVYTSRVSLETEEFENANSALHSAIASFGGIIVSENAHNLGSVGYRSLSMTVRIPQEHYDAFLSGLSDEYNVVSVQNTVDNLTERYYDNENRLKALRIQEERLFAMLEKSATVKEMLEIETRLCDVQYEIESLTNAQRTIDNNVKYATFHLNLQEVTKYTAPKPKTFGDRLGETLKGSGEGFLDFSEGLLFTCIYALPYLLLLGGITVIIVFSIRASIKKKRKKKDEE